MSMQHVYLLSIPVQSPPHQQTTPHTPFAEEVMEDMDIVVSEPEDDMEEAPPVSSTAANVPETADSRPPVDEKNGR